MHGMLQDFTLAGLGWVGGSRVRPPIHHVTSGGANMRQIGYVVQDSRHHPSSLEGNGSKQEFKR